MKESTIRPDEKNEQTDKSTDCDSTIANSIVAGAAAICAFGFGRCLFAYSLMFVLPLSVRKSSADRRISEQYDLVIIKLRLAGNWLTTMKELQRQFQTPPATELVVEIWQIKDLIQSLVVLLAWLVAPVRGSWITTVENFKRHLQLYGGAYKRRVCAAAHGRLPKHNLLEHNEL